jgi:hypothetical protein
LPSGSFEGELACALAQMELGYETGAASAVRELSFSVEQGADQLVEQLLDPTSAAAQAVATSFLNAMRLPEGANAQVVHAELQRRRLTHKRERRLQQAIAVDVSISGVSARDIETLDTALESDDAASTVGAHLEQNLAEVEGIDIGSVQVINFQPLPDEPAGAVGGGASGGSTPRVGNYTGFLEPEDGGCAQWNHLLATVLALWALL